MFIRKLAAIAALNLVALPPASALGSEASEAACPLQAHRVTAVAPYRADKRIGRARINQLRGAVLFIEAEQHGSAEWLAVELRRHLAGMQGPVSMADCPLDLEGIRMQVESRGPGFLVTLVAKDSFTAEEVLRRARLLL